MILFDVTFYKQQLGDACIALLFYKSYHNIGVLGGCSDNVIFCLRNQYTAGNTLFKWCISLNVVFQCSVLNNVVLIFTLCSNTVSVAGDTGHIQGPGTIYLDNPKSLEIIVARIYSRPGI